MNIEGLSLDQMQVALAVAQTGSFSAAARRFNRTQSSLSYAVATLERQLGVDLFDRTDGRRPRPTELGRQLLREIETVVRQANNLKEKAKSISAGLEPEVSLALDDHYPVETLIPLLRDIQVQFPSVQVRLNVETMGAVTKAVLDGVTIFGVTASVPDLAPGLIGDALSPIERIPVASSRHPLACRTACEGGPTHAAVLDQVQIVLSERREATAGRDYSVLSGRTWRVGDLHTKRLLLLAGLGWGFMPEHMVAGDIAEGRLQRLHADGVREKNSVAVIVVRLRDRVLGPASRWVLARLLERRQE